MNTSEVIKFFVICVLVGGCQAKKIDPFIAAKNPYSQIGVEGYVGAAMTSCMGMAPQGATAKNEEGQRGGI
jgi:hypothetical protein